MFEVYESTDLFWNIICPFLTFANTKITLLPACILHSQFFICHQIDISTLRRIYRSVRPISFKSTGIAFSFNYVSICWSQWIQRCFVSIHFYLCFNCQLHFLSKLRKSANLNYVFKLKFNMFISFKWFILTTMNKMMCFSSETIFRYREYNDGKEEQVRWTSDCVSRQCQVFLETYMVYITNDQFVLL